VANVVLSLIKRALVRRYPEWVAAYHDAKMRREFRRRPIVDTPQGFRFAGPATMREGSFEPEEQAFLSDRLKDADVFVDIGANVGYFTCIARLSGVRVVAVEPAPQNLDLLFKNVRANGWTDVEVFPVGLAERPGLGTLYGDGTGASLVTRWAGLSETWQRTIPLTTLDALLGSRFQGQRLVIKIDVEGTEHAVVAGATDTLARRPAPVWLLEVCFTENFPDGVNPHFREVFDRFWTAGYSVTSLEAGRPVGKEDIARWLETGRRDFGYVSYIFEKSDVGAAGASTTRSTS
jgi:FkbM family methyltransferase